MLIRAGTAGALLLLLGACSTGWQHMQVKGLSYSDLFSLTAHVIDSEGFVISDPNPNTGVITTKWDYNKLIDRGRFPIRRRVEAHIDPEEERIFLITVRIKQEALWRSYKTMKPETEKGWESYDYDKKKTHDILTRIKLLVKEFKPSQDFQQRFQRASDEKSTIPELLKEKEGEEKL